jgi:hypothetical protein
MPGSPTPMPWSCCTAQTLRHPPPWERPGGSNMGLELAELASEVRSELTPSRTRRTTGSCLPARGQVPSQSQTTGAPGKLPRACHDGCWHLAVWLFWALSLSSRDTGLLCLSFLICKMRTIMPSFVDYGKLQHDSDHVTRERGKRPTFLLHLCSTSSRVLILPS